MQLEAVFGLFIFIQVHFRLAGGPGAILGRLMERVEKLSAVAEQCPTDGFLSPMQLLASFWLSHKVAEPVHVSISPVFTSSLSVTSEACLHFFTTAKEER